MFNRAAEWIRQKGSFTPEMLREQPAREVIAETYRVLGGAISSTVEQEVPETLTYALENNAFIFSGLKTYHSLSDVGLALTDEKGSIKSFEAFGKDVEKINDRYNRNYLRAEYQHAVAASQMAVKWNDFQQDGDRYDLQYRTAGDERVREEHRRLDGITLPPDDPFWASFFPPNGWGCRCTAVQVRKGKYPRSDSQKAIDTGNEITDDLKKRIFRFNPGKELKIFPDKHPYNKAPKEAKNQIRKLAKEHRAEKEFNFTPCESIEEAVTRAKSYGIAKVDFGKATLEQINAALEAFHEEARAAKIDLSEFRFTTNLNRQLKTKERVGGVYDSQKNTLQIDVRNFESNIFHEVESYQSRIDKLQKNIEGLKKQIEQSESRLGKSKTADKVLKNDIKTLKSRITDIEIKINKYRNHISRGEEALPFTVSTTLRTIKEQVKCEVHHEFGHYVDYKLGRPDFNENHPVSEYARSSRNENFAEWWAHYRVKGKNDVPGDLLKIFERYERDNQPRHKFLEKNIDIAYVRSRRKEIRESSRELTNKKFTNEQFGKPISISNNGIKEFLNQPHKHLEAKNEMLPSIADVIKKSKYIGYGEDKHNPSIVMHIFETTISDEKSWIVARELPSGECRIHSVSDNEGILKYIQKKPSEK